MAMGKPVKFVPRTSEKFQGISSPCVPVLVLLHTLSLLHHQMQCTDSEVKTCHCHPFQVDGSQKRVPFTVSTRLYMDIYLFYIISEVSSHLGRKLVLNSLPSA